MKRRKILAFALAFVLVLSLLPTTPAFADDFSGGGTESNPYLITTKEELQTFRDNVNENISYEGQYFRLEQDIEFDMYWTPIGDIESKMFAGTFDGNGHVLKLDGTISGSYRGVFGYVSQSGTIKNLGVEGELSRDDYVGGLIGYNLGTVKNCYNTGNVTGNGNTDGYCYVGGLIGYNLGTVENCYNTGKVTGNGKADGYCYVGGLVGFQNRNSTVPYYFIKNCYNTGSVTVNGEDGTAGGVVGKNNPSGADAILQYCYNTGSVTTTGTGTVGGVEGHSNSPVKACYYLKSCVASVSINNKSTPLETEDMKKRASFVDWDFSNTWYMGGRGPLLLQNFEQKLTPNTGKYDLDGDGKKDSVFELATADDLIDFGAWVNNGHGKSNAVLTADIDLTGRDWAPIGVNYSDFTGIFDGMGHSINGLNFSTGQNGYGGNLTYLYQGLFGVIRDGALVRNFTVCGKITLAHGDMSYIGGAVGLAYGGAKIDTVTSYVTITDDGTSYSDLYHIGGVVGRVGNNWPTDSPTPGHVNNCQYYGTIDIEKGHQVGGIVGCAIKDSFVTNSTNFGTVGDGEIGHIAGVAGGAETGSTVKNCANYGGVSAKSHDCVGGVVGYANDYVTILNCLNGGTVTAQPKTDDTSNKASYIGGILGYQNSSNFNGITRCFNYGTVKPSSGGDGYTGAIVGWSRTTNGGNKITDNYYLNSSSKAAIGSGTIGTNNTAVGTYRAASGAVAYSLQGTQEEQVWGQTVSGTECDAYPVIGGAKVYYGTGCNGISRYANTEVVNEHNFANGVCTNCGAAATLTPDGDGTYQIGSKADYIFFTNLVNNDGAQHTLNAKLTADIDLSGYDYVPIGRENNEFIGEFNGNGYTIKNITLTVDKSYMGVFGKTKGAAVGKLTVIGTVTAVDDGLSYVGGLIGHATDTSVHNCRVKLAFKDNGNIEHVFCLGGVIGKACGGTKVTLTQFVGSMDLYFGSHLGGIIGAATEATKEKPVIIENCTNYGDMRFDVSRSVAGILGNTDTYTTVLNCANYGDITIQQSDKQNRAGGIIGNSTAALTLTDCGNYGDLSDGRYNASLGGIVGFVNASSADFGGIQHCFNYGQVTINNEQGSTYWGALIGYVQPGADESNIAKINELYYLINTAPSGYGSDGQSIVNYVVTADRVKNGELAYKLRDGRSVPWGQELTVSLSYPALYVSTNTYRIYKVTFMVDNAVYATQYGNFYSGIYSMPEKPMEDFQRWTVSEDPDSDVFTGNGSIKEDMTVYAQMKRTEPDLTISNLEEMQAFCKSVNEDINSYTDKYILLTADLDLKGSETNPWTPIGSGKNYWGIAVAFAGTFDGGGHKITGLYVDGGENSIQGLFAQVSGGTVQNLNVEGTVKGAGNVGGIVGMMNNSGSIINCSYAGKVIGTDASIGYVGGVVSAINGGELKNCVNHADVESGGCDVGGVVGNASQYKIIEACYNTGSVKGKSDVGGLIGNSSYSGSIKECYNTGDVTGTGEEVGGLVGCLESSCSVTNCYNTGGVTGEKEYVGGVVGFAYGERVTNCYNMGTVVGKSSNVGPVAGRISGTSIGTCYHLEGCATNTTSCDTSTALKRDEMSRAAGFKDWDFDTVWFIYGDHPYLRSCPELHDCNIKTVAAQGTKASATLYIAKTGSYSVIFATYSNGVLTAVETVPLTVTTQTVGDQTVITTGDMTLNKNDKVMLWGSLAAMAPQCGVYTVK